MAVVLSDGSYRVRKRAHPSALDAHGQPVPAVAGTAGPWLPGAAVEQPDSSWTLRLDAAVWPVRAGDEVEGPSGRQWVLTGFPRVHRNAVAADVDYVGATAALRDVHI